MTVGDRFVNFTGQPGDPSFASRFSGPTAWASVVRITDQVVKLIVCPRFSGLYVLLVEKLRAEELMRLDGWRSFDRTGGI